MVGLIAQPTTSLIDFTSGTLNQLQRTVNISAEVKRIRPTRAIHADGILTSYNSHEANGRELLKNLGKSNLFHSDVYVSHCLIGKILNNLSNLFNDINLIFLKIIFS